MGLTVNDRTFDSGRGEIRFGSKAVAIQKIGYGDKLNTETVRRIGSQEQDAITDGEYETEDVTVTVEQAIWNRQVSPSLPANGFGNFRFVISVFLTDPELGSSTARLEKCRITGIKDNIEAGPGAIVCEVTIKTQQIVRNGKTLNRRSGVSSIAEALTL